jgi:DNA-binding transcriptional regulator YiaG
MTDAEFTADALQRALKALAPDQLAERLGATSAQLRAWVAGEARMPNREFLLLVDLLLDESSAEPSFDVK